MSSKIISFFSISFLFSIGQLWGNNDPVMVTTTTSEEVVEIAMNLEINGAVKLYSVIKEEGSLLDIEAATVPTTNKANFINWVLNPNKDFYIGFGDNVEAITPGNFKKLVKKYFSDAPELTQRIGKRGFRYKNLPSMILYYNKIVNKGEVLTKGDLVASN
ncbi:MAG: hypothetical protein AB8G86_24250 [Saprospiraceae bacterium]